MKHFCRLRSLSTFTILYRNHHEAVHSLDPLILRSQAGKASVGLCFCRVESSIAGVQFTLTVLLTELVKCFGGSAIGLRVLGTEQP